MSLVIAVADAVVAVLKAEPLKLEAMRAYRPEFDLAELTTMRVTVVPKGLEISGSGRNANQHDIRVDVALQQKVTAVDNTALDPLMTLVEQVANQLRLRRLELGGGGSAIWVKTENDPIYAPEQLQTKQVFISLLTFTFRVVK